MKCFNLAAACKDLGNGWINFSEILQIARGRFHRDKIFNLALPSRAKRFRLWTHYLGNYYT